MTNIQSENHLWRYVRGVLPAACHACRIESGATVLGFPDVDLCHEGVQAGMELKHWHSRKGFTLRPSQHRWMQDRIKAGGRNIWILASYPMPNGPTEFYLIHGRHSKLLANSNGPKSKGMWKTLATMTWVGSIYAPDLEYVLFMRGL